MNYLYLHGFASGPESTKAIDLRDHFTQKNIELILPDLNQDSFLELTLTRQLQQCEALLQQRTGPWTLIGSSLGGLTAAWLAQRNPQIERLVLLAPAFQFLAHWQPKLGAEQLTQWQQLGAIEVYHHAQKQFAPIGYGFWQDMLQYDEQTLNLTIPILILHGSADEVIPIETSRRFSTHQPCCTLVELNSDHGLGDVLPLLWNAIEQFCNLGGDLRP